MNPGYAPHDLHDAKNQHDVCDDLLLELQDAGQFPLLGAGGEGAPPSGAVLHGAQAQHARAELAAPVEPERDAHGVMGVMDAPDGATREQYDAHTEWQVATNR